MAIVRFSKELVDRIVRNAEVKMNPPIQRAMELRPDNAWGQKIYDIIFKDVKPFIPHFPNKWLRTVDRFTLTKVGKESCKFDFSFSSPQAWPYGIVETELFKTTDSYCTVGLSTHPVWLDLYDEVVAFNERLKAAKDRQTEFVGMVEKVCDAYSTLAPALKAYPALWELVPEDVKDKHREVKGREKKEIVLDIDVNKFAAMSAAAKFGL